MDTHTHIHPDIHLFAKFHLAIAMQAPDPYPSRAIPLRALEEDDYVEAVSAMIPEQDLHRSSAMHQPTYRTWRSLHSTRISIFYVYTV